MTRKAGFAAIIGRPNVGKSTLLNRLVGEKIAGVSPKPQTTRNIIRGIVSRPQGQVVFIDTPGLHEPQDMLGNWMVQEVEKILTDIDLLYFMVLPANPHPFEKKILEKIKEMKTPTFLLVNQVDRYPKPEILPVLDYYHRAHGFLELIPISAKHGDQVKVLMEKTWDHLPEGEPLFPEDQISDAQERFIVAELIREKVMQQTKQEIPYSTAVMIDAFKERSATLVDISASVIVEKESQKGIVVGKKGQKMKEIGQAARMDIEKFLGRKVFLQLWVKVMPGWKKDRNAMRQLGYFSEG